MQGLGCDLLGLLGAFGFSLVYVCFCVFGGFVPPLVSFAIMGSWAIRGRLRVLGWDAWVCWLGLIIVVH